MTIYYLNIQNGVGLVVDEEGRDLPDLDAARDAAKEGIRSMISEEAKTGLLDLTGRIEVMDADGNVLCLVSYEEAMELRLTGRTR